MSRGKPWTYDELVVAMNLYCKLPFGQLRHGNPLIIKIADKMGRTPSSLSMKLCNLASLDSYHQARGVKGLKGASRLDREVWTEFNANWEQFGVVSEQKLQGLLGLNAETGEAPGSAKILSSKGEKINFPKATPSSQTEAITTVKVRLGQRFFRQSVLASYNTRCCITDNPIPELLVASHIVPWSKYPEHRLNPRNGLCLASTHDTAFDKGLVTLDEDYRLVIGSYLREFLPSDSLTKSFLAYEGKRITMPDKFCPDGGFLKKHREEIFQN